MFARASFNLIPYKENKKLYFLLQYFGFRLYYFRDAYSRRYPLDTYWAWLWEPRKKKGTYIEDSMYNNDYINIGMLTKKESLVYLVVTKCQ